MRAIEGGKLLFELPLYFLPYPNSSQFALWLNWRLLGLEGTFKCVCVLSKDSMDTMGPAIGKAHLDQLWVSLGPTD